MRDERRGTRDKRRFVIRHPSSIIHRNDGTSIIFAVFVLIVLSILGLTIFSLISSDSGSAASQLLSSRALFAAESGWQIGAQAVKDDKDATPQTVNPATNGYFAYVFLEGGYGNSYEGSPASGANFDRACFHGQSLTDSTPRYHRTRIDRNECILFDALGAYVSIWNFQQRLNLLGGKIQNIDIIIRAARGLGPGSNPRIQLEYSIDGGTNWLPAGNILEIDNPPNEWGSPSYRIVNIGNPGNWQALMNETNSRIRARRTDGGTGVWCYIDWLALRVTVEVDAQTEPWGSNSYITLPVSIENGNIQSVTVNDELGKVNINYAPRNLMWRLFTYCGISSNTSRTFADRIISYRRTKWFNTKEEVKQISGMTEEYFNLIKDDITVYSWVNQDVTRPSESRAPININTASQDVLKAVFRTAFSNESDIARLATDVYNQARIDPFTHMFSYYGNHQYFDNQPNYSRCLSAFLESRGYISSAQRNQIRNVTDGSYFNRDRTLNWAGNDRAGGTEFCYYSHTFLIESTGRSGNIERTVLQTYGDTYNYNTYGIDSRGVLALPTYIGETSPRPYWREEH